MILKMIVELKSSHLSCDKKMNQCCELAPQVESYRKCHSRPISNFAAVVRPRVRFKQSINNNNINKN